jgi:nitroimidazol reductase NimA-like FMN-containing flavoprotein (pyridoxamine 5'-phosphate oxidase superfamily)
MNNIDEPLLESSGTGKPPSPEPRLRERIARLVQGEPFAVLCTQGEEQPYGSVIAFAVSDDLGRMAFCTSRPTRKYSLLSRCRRVALVIDNRNKFQHDTRRVEAVTVTGVATELTSGDEHACWLEDLESRHPYLQEFLASPSCALFRVDVVRYLHVTRFQEVRQWLPPTSRS